LHGPDILLTLAEYILEVLPNGLWDVIQVRRPEDVVASSLSCLFETLDMTGRLSVVNCTPDCDSDE
jgi:hypothetical protein